MSDHVSPHGGQVIPAVELAACCLLKLDQAAAAEALIRRQESPPEPGLIPYYLGLALAAQGKAEEAVQQLARVCQHPSHGSIARKALLELIKNLARQKLAEKCWEGAGALITRGLEAAPEDEDLQEMLAFLGDHLPLAYLKLDKRAEAAAVWEKAQRDNPADMRIAHSLAILYYFWADHIEQAGGKITDEYVLERAREVGLKPTGKESKTDLIREIQKKEGTPQCFTGTERSCPDTSCCWRPECLRDVRDAEWRKAVANWVAVLNGNGFWEKWRSERANACGIPISDRVIEALRARLAEGLRRRIADYIDDYRLKGQPEEVDRLTLLSLDLLAELKTAEALKEVMATLNQKGRKVTPTLVCGAIMLKHIGQLEAAQKILAVAQATIPDEPCTDRLHWCLSPWLDAWIMIEDRRYDAAIELLDRKLEQAPSSNDGHDLYALACLEKGQALARVNEAVSAMEVWRSGLEHVRSRKKIGARIKDLVRETAITEATRLAGQGGIENLKTAISIVELALTLASSDRLKTNLSELYSVLAHEEFGEKSKPEGKRLARAKSTLEKALRINPNNARAKEHLAIVLTNMGINAANKNRWEEARTLISKAYELDPTSEYVRGSLSRVLSNLGVIKCNSAHARYGSTWEAGIRMLREAYRLDPKNQHARDNLIAAGQYPQSLP